MGTLGTWELRYDTLCKVDSTNTAHSGKFSWGLAPRIKLPFSWKDLHVQRALGVLNQAMLLPGLSGSSGMILQGANFLHLAVQALCQKHQSPKGTRLMMHGFKPMETNVKLMEDFKAKATAMALDPQFKHTFVQRDPLKLLFSYDEVAV